MKWKKSLEISSFYICIPKIMIRWCTVPEIWHMTDAIVIFHFRIFFALLKKWQKYLEKSSFYICAPKIMTRWCIVPEIWCEMDRRTNRWKNWHIDGLHLFWFCKLACMRINLAGKKQGKHKSHQFKRNFNGNESLGRVRISFKFRKWR